MNKLHDIESKLFRIFNSRFNIDFSQLDKDYYEYNLLGEFFRLDARDLLYIYFDVKNEFNIIIPEDDISNGKFSTFNGLLEIVKSQVMTDTVLANQ